MFLVAASLLWLACAAFDRSEFEEMEVVNEWVAKATRAATTIGGDFRTEIPYIIVCGDQGVGKSTTINRLVNAELFPMRSAEKAARDAPQTTVATLYQVTKDTSVNADLARVGTTCTSAACAKPECKMQDVKKEKLAEMVNHLQNNCFGRKTFGLNDIITVKYASPTAIQVSIVDLPGIQQSGKDSASTRDLTKKWLTKHPNSIILAVLRADNLFQATIVGILEEKVAAYKDRVVFVISKPKGVGQHSLKVVNMINDTMMKQFNAPGIALQSVDTSYSDADTSMDAQKAAEWEYFSNDPRYKDMPASWGIDRLTTLTQRSYLKVACGRIPLLMRQLQHEESKIYEELQTMPETSSVDSLRAIVVPAWQEKFRKMVELETGLFDSFEEHNKPRYDFIQVLEDPFHGGPIGYNRGLSCDDAFFDQWWVSARNLASEVKVTILNRFKQSANLTALEKLKMEPDFGSSAWSIVEEVGSCEEKDIKPILKRLVCMYVWSLGDPIEENVIEYRKLVTKEQLPSVLTRMVLQLCVGEPIDDLLENIELSEHRKDAVAIAFNLASIGANREFLDEKWRSYKDLLSHEQVCRGYGVMPLSEPADWIETEDEETAASQPEDPLDLTTPAGCSNIRGAIVIQSQRRCIKGLTAGITYTRDQAGGSCYIDVGPLFTETKERIWKHKGKEYKCCAETKKPENTRIQRMDIRNLPSATWFKLNSAGCGGMFGSAYHNGPKLNSECKVPVDKLEDMVGSTFEEIMKMLGLQIEY